MSTNKSIKIINKNIKRKLRIIKNKQMTSNMKLINISFKIFKNKLIHKNLKKNLKKNQDSLVKLKIILEIKSSAPKMIVIYKIIKL